MSWGLASIAVVLAANPGVAGDPSWIKHEINAKSIFEGAGVFDVDNDGKLDVVSGDTWYKAPGWTRYPVRKVTKQGTYMNCFSTMPMDVNADGHIDFITCSYFERNVGWVENPGEAGKLWTYHEIAKPGSSEAAVLVDLDGDGKPDVLPNAVNAVVWYSLEKAGPSPEWKTHDFTYAKGSNGHGIGTGDIDGDGKLDLLTPSGWFKAPQDRKSDRWEWHPDWNLGATGIQILARDFDGDGVCDLIYGMGHDVGLYWAKGTTNGKQKPTYEKHLIDKTVASVHVLQWADLDGDGKADELLTGKRVYAHEREADDVKAPIIAYYDFDKTGKTWNRHLIYQGEPAANAPSDIAKRDAQKDFPPGTAGTGLEMTVIDLDGDGDNDIVCPGKSGLYWFENRLKTK